MTLYATIDLPEGTQLTAQCPDMQTLTKVLAGAILHAALVSTIAPELPRVFVTHQDARPICSLCAAPLLPSGQCSSANCRAPRRIKSAAAKLKKK